MTAQLQLGADLEAQVRKDSTAGTVTSTTDCGSAGVFRVELVLVERQGRSDIEVVRIGQPGHTSVVPIDQLEALLRALSKAKDCSERRKARRAKP